MPSTKTAHVDRRLLHLAAILAAEERDRRAEEQRDVEYQIDYHRHPDRYRPDELVD